MPSIKDYEGKKETKKPRRRPGREEAHAAEEVAESAPEETHEEMHADADETTQPKRKKIHIEFPYSELVRAKVPKAFKVAETVAEEWVNNGNFENIPVGHPVAQMTVAAGLRKAKEDEKKLDEKGVFTMAKMGLEYAKSKLAKK